MRYEVIKKWSGGKYKAIITDSTRLISRQYDGALGRGVVRVRG